MKRIKTTVQSRTKTIKQRASMKYTGTKNVAAVLAVNHRNQAIIVSRRYK